MKKRVLLFICIIFLLSIIYIFLTGSKDISALLLEEKYDEVIHHLEMNYKGNDILAGPAMSRAYIKSLVFSGNIQPAVSFYPSYSSRHEPDAESAYLYKIARIIETCGYFLKQKGLKKILTANNVDPRVRDSWSGLIDFYHISKKYNSESAIFKNNIQVVMAHTIKNSTNRTGLIKKCLDQEEVDLVNLGLDCMTEEDAGLFRDRLMALTGKEGIHAADIMDLLKSRYERDVLDLAENLLLDENVSPSVKARVIIGLKGLPYPAVEKTIQKYLPSGEAKLKSSALNLMGRYININPDALNILIDDLSTGYNKYIYSAYRKIISDLDLEGFKKLTAAWHQFDVPIQEMIAVTTVDHNKKIESVNLILEKSDTLNSRLWYHILNHRVPPGETGKRGKIIFLLSIDTLRRDHLEIYGYMRKTMPRLSNIIKKKGLVFNQVYANTSWTLPSHVSMLSGLSPVDHGVNETHDRIKGATPYLPAFLKNQGFFTAAFVTSTLVSQQHHFDRGFDFFYYRPEEKAKNILDKVETALHTILNADTDRPIFVFIHLYDCHSPYRPEEKFDIFHDAPPHRVPGNDYINAQQNLYDGEIFYVDQAAGRFIEQVMARYDATFIITSDHGEEFLDHMGSHHGTTLYNEVVRIPFIIIAGEDRMGELRTDRNAFLSLQETPFILSRLLGLDFTAGKRDDRDRLIELLLYRDELQKIGLIQEQVKVIYDMNNNRFETYRIDGDPKEKDRLNEAEFPGMVRYLKERAGRLSTGKSGHDAVYDRDMTERLRELGYIN